MGISRRIFTREFKLAAIKEVEAGKPLPFVARQLEIKPSLLHRWKQELSRLPKKAFPGNGKRTEGEGREAELERKIGQLTMENDFLKKVLVALEEQQEAASGVGRSTRRSRKKTRQ